MRIVGTAGDTIFLPTIQGCAVGENDWIEKTDDPEADNAAPRFTLTQTVAPASTSTTAAAATSTTKATSTTAVGHRDHQRRRGPGRPDRRRTPTTARSARSSSSS